MEMVTVQLPRVLTIAIKKIGESIELDLAKVPANSHVFGTVYGWTQKINDAHAPITREGKNAFKGTEAEFVRAVKAEVVDVVESIYAGTVGTRAPIDPAAVARRELGRQLGVEMTPELYQIVLEAGKKVVSKKAA